MPCYLLPLRLRLRLRLLLLLLLLLLPLLLFFLQRPILQVSALTGETRSRRKGSPDAVPALASVARSSAPRDVESLLR